MKLLFDVSRPPGRRALPVILMGCALLGLTACAQVSNAEMDQLDFLAEEALSEIVEDEDKTPLPTAQSVEETEGVAVDPSAAPRWRSRELVDAMDIDPDDYSQCFRILDRELFNRCNSALVIKACADQSCKIYEMEQNEDLELAFDFDSIRAIPKVQPEPSANSANHTAKKTRKPKPVPQLTEDSPAEEVDQDFSMPGVPGLGGDDDFFDDPDFAFRRVKAGYTAVRP